MLAALQPAPRRLRHRRERACRTNRHVAYPPSAHDEPDLAGPISPPAPCELCSAEPRRTVARRAAPFDRAPLLRFLPLQRLLARDALSAAAVLWTIPLRRLIFATRPARPRTFRVPTSPLRFFAVRMRCGEARWRTCRWRFRKVHSHRVKAAGNPASHVRQRLTIVPASASRRIRHVVTLRNDPSIKRHRFADSPNRAGHASPSSLGAMFRYRPRLIAAWPSDWSFPLIARRRSWGSVAPFAGLLPHPGGGSFLIGPGPPACSSKRRAPIDFRRVDSPLHR
jgi:hypothetical protein